MQSIFAQTAYSSDEFWLPYNQVCLSVLCEGSLIEITEEGPKQSYYILNENSLLKLNKNSVLVEEMAVVKWKKISRFVECIESYCFGFKLVGKSTHRTFYVENQYELDKWVLNLSFVGIMENISADYFFVEELGKGSFSRVFLAVENTSQKKFAIKCIQKKDLLRRKNGLSHIINEIEIVRKLDHPNIIKLHKVYEDIDYVYLVLDYIEGKDLHKRLQTKNYSEEAAFFFVQKLLKTVDYLSSHNIIHRDIKPENLILESMDNDIEFKLADFGLAIEGSKNIEGKCGSLGFVAPEILKEQKYSSNVDVFSCGIVYYTLIAGHTPFKGKNHKEIYFNNAKCNINFKEKCWAKISIAVIDTIQVMTKADPHLRPSAKKVLRNNLFKTVTNSQESIDDSLNNERAQENLGENKWILEKMAERNYQYMYNQDQIYLMHYLSVMFIWNTYWLYRNQYLNNFYPI
ncbi:unnamed protein product [Blepharisma stoltei]|uniref:Protein kinase domain-containing protein n=1 Tax=Blepharisma stoltei TaxID=1481888 RepID=A0AAU9KAR9_9CILI|nr:unnamed protein product [Blepharisma stoltei]